MMPGRAQLGSSLTWRSVQSLGHSAQSVEAHASSSRKLVTKLCPRLSVYPGERLLPSGQFGDHWRVVIRRSEISSIASTVPIVPQHSSDRRRERVHERAHMNSESMIHWPNQHRTARAEALSVPRFSDSPDLGSALTIVESAVGVFDDSADRMQPHMPMRDGGTLSAGLRIPCGYTLCDSSSPERGVFSERYPSRTVVLRRGLHFFWDLLGANAVGANGGGRGSLGRGCRHRVRAVWGGAW